LADLGVAHRGVFLEAEQDTTNNDDNIRQHERRAILACKKAIQIYQGWLLDHNDDVKAAADTAMPQSQSQQPQHYVHSHNDDPGHTHNIVQHELASTYFCLAEIYRNSLTVTGNSNNFAYDYYDQAYRLWEILLNQQPQQWAVEDRRAVELSVAYCAMHLGVALLERSSSSDGNENFATEDLLSQIVLWMSTASSTDPELLDLTEYWMSGSSTGTMTKMEELQRLLEKLSVSNNDFSIQIDRLVEVYQRQLQLLQRAERYLLQAVETFRLYYREESETDALASALQHGGTVAVALGHGMEAVARYEEALALWYYNSDDDDVAATMTTHVTSVAQVLLALSDTYLQLNKYDEANDLYQNASEYFEYDKY
jgi:tetratricopeptide (TPR) repeat protein